MRKPHYGAMLTLLVLTAVLATPPRVVAEATTCRGALGAVTVDAVTVPNGATCTLTGTQVRGNIDVGSGATLQATGVTVGGNVQARGHARVAVA